MTDEQKRYFLKRPTGKRKSYVLVCYVALDRKHKQYVPLSESLKKQTDKINEHLKSGLIQNHEAEVLLKELIQNEYKKNDVRDQVLKHSVLSTINQKLFDDFWYEVYSVRELRDESSPRYDFIRAFRIIEPLALSTASQQDLKAALKKNSKNVAQQRRATDRLNEILRYLESDFVLVKPKETFRVIQHLTEVEFKKVSKLIVDEPSRHLATLLFCSGLRLSEALAVKPTDFVNGKLLVERQLTKTGELRAPKRDKIGTVVVVPWGVDSLREWFKVKDRELYRHKFYDELMSACKKAFPKDRTKWIGPHDLRHSHAIHLLGKGASLTQVALNLRNRVDVCQKYYTGYAHSEGTADALKRLISS